MGKPIAPPESSVPDVAVVRRNADRRERLILLGLANDVRPDSTIYDMTTLQLRRLLAGA